MAQIECFVIYADFAQMVLLDSRADLMELALGTPFWGSEAPGQTLFSVRLDGRAMSIGGMNKDYTLLEVATETSAEEIQSWAQTGEARLHLPSGELWITEIIDLEPPKLTLRLEPGWYAVQAFIGAFDWDQSLELPEDLHSEEAVHQRVRLELRRET